MSCASAGLQVCLSRFMSEMPSLGPARPIVRDRRIIGNWPAQRLAEEASEAYKDVAQVVDVLHEAGIADRVARMRPIAVVKG